MTGQAHIGAGDIPPFKELLLSTCGFRLENERESTLIEGLERRMALCGARSADEYRLRLVAEPDELLRLVELLTINETYFFREPDQLRLMRQHLIPELIAAHPDRPVKILSAGCSTGEEPYSIAMLLHEAYGPDCARRFTIVGVDIDASALAQARRGVYGRGSFRGMDQAMQARYFTPHGSGEFRLREEVRALAQMQQVNLLARDYPPLMACPDIILYRNVSIYFPGQVQRDIFSRLAELLNDGGYLFVSATETMHHNIGVLPLLQRGTQFIYRKGLAPAVKDRRQNRRSTPMAVSAPASTPARRPAATQAPRTGKAQPKVKPAAPGPQNACAPARSPQQVFDEALERAQQGRPEEALALLDELLAGRDCPAKASPLKAAILLESARVAEAKAMCGEMLAKTPLCLEAVLMLGLIARQEGEDDEALKRFREALYLDAACWPAHFYMAEDMAARGGSKRTRSGLETVVRILEQGSLEEHDREYFPLNFKAEHFLAMCRHKLSLMQGQG